MDEKRGIFRILVLLAAAALFLSACGSDSGDGDTETDTEASGGVTCEGGVTFGFFGALTGENSNLGLNEFQGAQLAIDQFNEENPNCEVTLEKFDSQGSPDQAPGLAQQAAADARIVGMIGPAFSGESRAANEILSEAGIPIVTPSATGVDLSEQGWETFHRVVANDNAQGPAVAYYITEELGAERVAVIDDRSEYGKGLADVVRDELGDAVVFSDQFDDQATEFASTVTGAESANVDAIFFGGYYAQAGPLARQLADGGVDATFIGPDGVNDQGFIDAGGDATEGAILTAPAAPLEEIDGGEEFAQAYEEAFGAEPGIFSVESYDAANILLEAVKDGNTTREDIEAFIDDIDYQGLTKNFTFTETGELDGDVAIYAYQVEGGEIVPVGLIENPSSSGEDEEAEE